jgi:hypothetical protein
VVEKGKQMAKRYGMGALSTAGGAVGFGLKTGLKGAAGVGLGIGYGAYYGGKAVGSGAYYGGKAIVAGGMALANKISAWRNGGGSGESGSAEQTSEQSSSMPDRQWAAYAPQTQTGFEGFGSTPVGQQSPKIAAMARAVDAHNAGQTSVPAHQSPKIAAMANAFNEHNQNPGKNIDPYGAGQAAAAQTQKPAKQPPKSLHNQHNNS